MESKPWYLSKTMIGLALTVLGLVLAHWNLKFATDDETTNAVANAVGSIAACVGPVLAAYGRIKANTTLTLTKQ